MLSLKANDKSKTLKDEFVDITLNELSSAYQYVNMLSPELKRYLLNGSEDEIEPDTLFEYKIHWITLFSDFTKDELRLIPIEGTDYSDLSVNWLYGHCEQFLKQPESYVELKDFDHQGKNYELIKPIQTISGAEMLFGNANYRQFMLGSQLASMIERNKEKNDGGIGSLVQLVALLYSDGKDSSEDVVNRAKTFGEVNALYGWSAYFFFVELVERYKDYFLLSTTKNPPPRIQRASALQQLKASLSKTIFGKLLPSKWLKQEYLILQT